MTDVPSSIPGTCEPATASTVSASKPALWGSHTDAKPWSATAWNRAVISSSGAYSFVGKNTPIFMAAR